MAAEPSTAIRAPRRAPAAADRIERPAAAPAEGGWRARLALAFRGERGRTVVARRHSGPLCIQRPFYPGDGVCHVYVLHPPGGLAGGDRLVLSCTADSGAAALVTTPAATKLYRSLGPPSRQDLLVRVAAGASFEWLPLDTILFGGSIARITTEVRLAAGARFVGWEMTALGRPASGDRYATGRLDQRTRILVDGDPILLERTTFDAGDPVLESAWGLGGHTVLGTLYAYPADSRALTAARERLDAFSALTAGATCVDGLLVVRALAAEAEALRDAFESVWAALRAAVIGRAPSAPRIWRT